MSVDHNGIKKYIQQSQERIGDEMETLELLTSLLWIKDLRKQARLIINTSSNTIISDMDESHEFTQGEMDQILEFIGQMAESKLEGVLAEEEDLQEFL